MSEALRLEENGTISSRVHPPAACEAVRFYGRELHIALAAAAEYLHDWERSQGYSPAVVALHDEFSWEDAGRDIAWQLTVVLRNAADSQ